MIGQCVARAGVEAPPSSLRRVPRRPEGWDLQARCRPTKTGRPVQVQIVGNKRRGLIHELRLPKRAPHEPFVVASHASEAAAGAANGAIVWPGLLFPDAAPLTPDKLYYNLLPNASTPWPSRFRGRALGRVVHRIVYRSSPRSRHGPVN